MKLPLLYSRTKVGNVQTWEIEVVGNKFRTHEGILDGKITTSEWTECEGKNLGKKNETSPEEQALKEAKARHQKKLDKGYYEDIEGIDIKKFFEPMTANKWKDRKNEIEFPVFAQPKLDGMRCITKSDGMWSRRGKPVVSAPHILKQLSNFLKKHPNTIFDGELYTHKLKDNFDEIISLAKQTKPTEEDLIKSEKHLEYWVYDYLDSSKPNMILEERLKKLSEIVKELKTSNSDLKVVLVKTKKCETLEELDEEYASYLEDGMEGQMIRIPGSVYENKRCNSLLKRKEFQDVEFEIVDVLPGRGGHANIAAKVVLKLKDGRTFEAGMIGSHKYCAWLLENKNKVIGKMGTVVFQNYTPDGKPRFGKFKIVRDYE